MGDRGNIGIVQPGGKDTLFLYSHWGGSELPKTLQNALARQLRWDDPTYLARIIFCEMVKGQEDGETGFGISSRITDNEHPVLIVNCRNQVVRIRNYNWYANRFSPGNLLTMTFNAFCHQEDISWAKLGFE